jgi:hypothetical protein
VDKKLKLKKDIVLMRALHRGADKSVNCSHHTVRWKTRIFSEKDAIYGNNMGTLSP